MCFTYKINYCYYHENEIVTSQIREGIIFADDYSQAIQKITDWYIHEDTSLKLEIDRLVIQTYQYDVIDNDILEEMYRDEEVI